MANSQACPTAFTALGQPVWEKAHVAKVSGQAGLGEQQAG